MCIDYNLTCDDCGCTIDGSLISASEVRRVAKNEGTAYRYKGKDLCRRCFAQKKWDRLIIGAALTAATVARPASDAVEAIAGDRDEAQIKPLPHTRPAEGEGMLRMALKPFADYADPDKRLPEQFHITSGSHFARRQLTMGDCYAAAAVLATSRPAEAEEGWRPIETALKDGEPIDVWVEGEGRCCDVSWAKSSHECVTPYCDSCPKDWNRFGWRDPLSDERLKPTHWMPRPDPPRDAGFNRIKQPEETSP